MTVNYQVLAETCRDVVCPKMKYMTRQRRDEPYMWIPFDFDGLTSIMEFVSESKSDYCTCLLMATRPLWAPCRTPSSTVHQRFDESWR